MKNKLNKKLIIGILTFFIIVAAFSFTSISASAKDAYANLYGNFPSYSNNYYNNYNSYNYNYNSPYNTDRGSFWYSSPYERFGGNYYGNYYNYPENRDSWSTYYSRPGYSWNKGWELNYYSPKYGSVYYSSPGNSFQYRNNNFFINWY